MNFKVSKIKSSLCNIYKKKLIFTVNEEKSGITDCNETGLPTVPFIQKHVLALVTSSVVKGAILIPINIFLFQMIILN